MSGPETLPPTPNPAPQAYEFMAPVIGPDASEAWMWLSDNPDGTVTVGRYEGTQLISEKVPKEIFLTSQMSVEQDTEKKKQEIEVAEEAGEIAVENSVEEPRVAEEFEKFDEPRQSIWNSPSGDRPVTIVGSLGRGEDGREYLKIEGSDAGIPADEVEWSDSDTGSGGTTEEPPEELSSLGSEDHGKNESKRDDIPSDLAAEIEKLGLSLAAIEKAREKGIPNPENFLIRILRSSDRSARQRWEVFLETPLLKPPSEDESKKLSRLHPDQVKKRTKLGQKRGQLRVQLEKDIIDRPKKIRHELKRPGGSIPVARNVRQRRKAKKIFQVKKAEEKGKGVIRDNGKLGRGFHRRRAFLKSIRSLDRAIVVDRSKLSPPRRHELKDLVPDRTHLAARVINHHENLRALEHNRLNPSELEPHELYPDLKG